MPEGLADLEREIGRDPKMRRFFELAREYQKLGRLDDAARVCTQGLERNPSHSQARVLLAQLLLAKGQTDQAAAQVDRVLLALPESVPANHLAGDIALSRGDGAKALKHYRIVELFEPGRPQVKERIASLEGDAASPVPSTAQEAPVTASAAPSEEGPEEPAAPAVEESAATVAMSAMRPEDLRAGDAEAAPAGTHQASSAPPMTEAPPQDDVFAQDEGASWAFDAAGEAEPSLPGPAAEVPAGSPGDFSDTASTAREEVGPPEDTAEAPIFGSDEQSFKELLPEEDEEPLLQEPEADVESDLPELAPEPEIPPEGESASADLPFTTVTLAELYERQGYPEKAVEVYQRVLLSEPDNESVRERIQELMRRMAGEAPDAAPVAEEDVQRGLRQKRIEALQGWLRRVREEPHV